MGDKPAFVSAIIEVEGEVYRVVLKRRGEGAYRQVGIERLPSPREADAPVGQDAELLPSEYYI